MPDRMVALFAEGGVRARWLLGLAIGALGLSGCAIGPTGMLAGRVTSVDGGWVLEAYVLGVHVRAADDPGVAIGVARRISVFLQNEVAAPRSGWHLFLLPVVLMLGQPLADPGTSWWKFDSSLADYEAEYKKLVALLRGNIIERERSIIDL